MPQTSVPFVGETDVPTEMVPQADGHGQFTIGPEPQLMASRCADCTVP